MFKRFNKFGLSFYAAFVAGFLAAPQAANAGAATGNTFSNIAENITSSIEEVPGMVTGISYMLGLLMGVVGVLKLKDHVENPQQTPMKDGAIRLAAGGALFGLPIVMESMLNTIGTTTNDVSPAILNKVEFRTN